MYIKVLLNYILGYVSVKVEGFFTERLINICKQEGVFIFNIKRDKSTILYVSVPISDFRRLSKIAKKTKCRLKIQKKCGLPFIFNKYKKRKIFGIAIVACILFIVYFSNFVWNIEINGLNNINKEEITRVLTDEGLVIGKFKNKINTKDIINRIRLEREDIAWVGIDIQGTNAVINIVEADKKPEIINEEEYCNIIADKDACIVKINAQNGTKMVNEGDVVKKGTVLIGGWMEGKYTGTRYVHAEGTIYAKVWYTHKERIYFKNVEKNRTGNEEKKYEINVNNFSINLYKKLSNFENYDTIKEQKKLKLFSNLYLPLGVSINKNYELKNCEVVYTEQEAKEIGISKSKEELNKNLNSQNKLINTYINTYPESDYIDVEVIYEVNEKIGTKEKIVF